MSGHNNHFEDEEGNESEIWDEYRWEEFFKESDKRTEKYSQLLDKYMDHPDRDRIIAEEMGWTHLLDETDNEYEEWIDEFIIDEVEEGEEWKRLTDFTSADFNDFEQLPVYKLAYSFTIDAKNLIEEHLTEPDDESIDKFAGSVIIPPAKIAGGFSFGFELDSLGGNIANCKRGLNAANRMLDALYEIGEKKLLDREIYLEYYGRAKEVRDELAIYIVELREQFKRGIP